MKSGFITIIGRPNVGKSTLLNKLLGQKIVIATDKPQTTRRRIKGILTNEFGQAVFIDTPGIHRPLDKLGEFLVEESKLAIPDADLILFLVDGSEPAGLGDKWIVENLLGIKTPVIIVLNKVDKVKNLQKREEILLTYKTLFKENLTTVKISALTGRNIDTLTKTIFKKLPEGDLIYDEDEVTDESVRSIAQEIIREKILLNTKDEVPHSVAVQIDKYEETPEIDRVFVNIYVEHDSQKGILIGKKGAMLKKIGTEARIELEELVQKKVFLSLQVKVEKDWRKKQKNIENWINS